MSNTQARGTKKKLPTYYTRLCKFYGSANKNYALIFMPLSLFDIRALIVDKQSEASEYFTVNFLLNIYFLT